MQTLTLTLAANQVVAFDIAGSYFEIIDSVGLVSVNFYDASGSRTKDLELQRVLSGFFVKGRFSRFEISEASGTAQAITILYGSTEGGTRRSPGIVTVTNKISAGITQLEIANGALSVVAYSTVTLIAPASNPRGVLVRKCVASVTAGSGGSTELRMIAAPSVPLTGVPSNAYQMCAAAPAASQSAADVHQDQNYQLPANWGIWAFTNHVAVPAFCVVSLAYELL